MLNPNNPNQIITLTNWINDYPSVPEMVGKMGLFVNRPIDTRIFAIDRTADGLQLLPVAPVGSRGPSVNESKGKTELFECSYIPSNFQLNAPELAMVRQMGSEGMKTVPTALQNRMRKSRNLHLATWEHLRVGALKGQILDSDGSTVIADLYTRFSITQITKDFTLGTTTTDILTKVVETKTSIEDAAGGIAVDNFVALCGRTWFNRFVAHPNVQKAYQNYQEAASRLGGDNRKGFVFGGVEFKVYNGRAGNYRFIADSEAYMFPTNVADMFETYFCPPNHVDYVNSNPGLPIFVSEKVLDHGAGYDYLCQSNPFMMNNRPGLVAKLTTSD